MVGQRIREYRDARGWTQTELARRVTLAGTQMHQPTVARLEAGARPIRVDELQSFATALGTTPDSLVRDGRSDSWSQAYWLFSERTARLMAADDEVSASELALDQARERREAVAGLVDEARGILDLARASGSADQEAAGDGDGGEPREEA